MRAAAALAALAAALAAAAALPRGALLPHGAARGDARLRPGDDESSAAVPLRRDLPFYGRAARRLYVGTNGVISTQDFPRETQYVDDDFPTDFPVIAPFLADIDTTGGRGNIYYRQDDSLDVLNQAADYIRAGFPQTAGSFVPTDAFLATWEDVGAYEEVSQDTEPSKKLNTFQAVVAYNASDAYAIFLYPDDGLQFFGTRPKESYNVHLELPARVGFSRGDGDNPKREGLFYSVASSERALKHLYQASNVMVPGVWVFHVGSASPLANVVPAGGGGHVADAATATTAAAAYGEDDHAPTALPPGTLPARESGAEPGGSLPEIAAQGPPPPPAEDRDRGPHPDADPDAGAPGPARLPRRGDTARSHPADPSSQRYGQHGVGVEEDVSFNADAFTYSAAGKETCRGHGGRCSPHAVCTDYATGSCCHCRATYYGNGRQCLPEGAVHRLNGKVSGRLAVGAGEAVRFGDVDLHAYIVGGEGRAYAAASPVPRPAARALLPLAPVGGLFGWLFALEEPGSENGFSVAGADFTQHLEVTFYPGEETVRVTQRAEGLGPEGHLRLRTHVEGRLPLVPEDVAVHVAPYTELYRYGDAGATSTAHREYVLTSDAGNRTLSYRLRQNITFAGCPHARRPPPTGQRLRVERVFALYDGAEQALRYATASRVSPAADEAERAPAHPCADGTHACHPAARCRPGPGSDYACECAAGYRGDGRRCEDVDECAAGPCHPAATCTNSPGSFSCRCAPGYEGDGFRCAAEPAEQPRSLCERWRQSLLEHYGGSPRGDQYVPQCDAAGAFAPRQCHGDSGYCWCVDQSGRELQGTRSEPGSPPPCLPSVAPPSVQPTPRPDVSPPAAGTFLLYAQGQQIGYLPLNGTRLQKEAAKTLLSLHGSIVVGIDYDCREKMLYWTDVAGRTINRASLEPGAEPEPVISSGLLSPEGLAVDHLRRAVFWTDSGLDKIERARLDGSERRVLFDTELVNPRAIAVDPVRGNLYWTDWNREAPKIETSTVSGANRRILVNKDIGLPNGLTFDPFSKLLCWADAGTKNLECTLPDGTGRRVVQNNLNYPFSIVSYANHFYHTDWRRDGVIAVNKDTGAFTDEYLPEQRSHLYGITAVYPYCPGARK
ncbi:nidogen-2 [Apteryx mantelli]|uniref:Nidogen-2 n=1 Tax=Apteryx mantelli TaxID=2696672 RepID=A0ABM4EEZ8_9AVES